MSKIAPVLESVAVFPAASKNSITEKDVKWLQAHNTEASSTAMSSQPLLLHSPVHNLGICKLK